VARELGVSHKQVSRITSEFIHQLSLLMTEYEVVIIEGLGRFQVQRIHTNHNTTLVTGRFKKGKKGETRSVALTGYFRVNFSKSPTLKKLLNEQLMEMTMEKYAVDQGMGDQEQLEKQAAGGCPECGEELVKHGSVLVCPKHGSEPFESQRGDT
jgi:nucleoid DNA-binding protein